MPRAGISSLTIYFIETGRTESPQKSTLKALEGVLGHLPKGVQEEVQEEGLVEDFEFLGPFPVEEWKNVVGTEPVPCIYVFYDSLKRPVRIGETEDLGRRLKEYADNYWWFKRPAVESFAYVVRTFK